MYELTIDELRIELIMAAWRRRTVATDARIPQSMRASYANVLNQKVTELQIAIGERRKNGGVTVDQRTDELRQIMNIDDPIAQAKAIQAAMKEHGWSSQTEASEHIGLGQKQVSDRLRLLRLPPEQQRRVSSGDLPMYKALEMERALRQASGDESVDTDSENDDGSDGIVPASQDEEESETLRGEAVKDDHVETAQGFALPAGPELVELKFRISKRFDMSVFPEGPAVAFDDGEGYAFEIKGDDVEAAIEALSIAQHVFQNVEVQS